MDVFEKIEYMASRGFIAEVAQDSAVQFEFVEKRADYDTGKPTGHGVAWRGCYAFFTKEGKYIWDDVGCFAPEDGGAQRAFDELVETFEHFIKEGIIDEKALKDNDLSHYYLSAGTQECNVMTFPTKGEDNIYFTSMKKPEIGEWYLQGDADGGSDQIFDIRKYKGGEEPHGYATIVDTTNKELNLPLISAQFVGDYKRSGGTIKKVNIKTGRRNIQVGDSTMGELQTIIEPIARYGYVRVI